MSPEPLFQIHLVLGYVAWLLCFGAYVWPWLKSMDRVEAQRAIATLHSFRFFGLVGIADLILDYYHAIQADLPAMAGQLGATYAISIIYVPLLMITHIVAF